MAQVFRDQYFAIGDEIITAVPGEMVFLFGSFIITEMATPGTEALTFSLLTTFINLGGPMSKCADEPAPLPPTYPRPYAKIIFF